MPQDKALIQLKRIRGQIDGVISMYNDERQCVGVVRQIIAVRNSLSTVARDLLTSEAYKCSREQTPEELDKVLKELFKY